MSYPQVKSGPEKWPLPSNAKGHLVRVSASSISKSGPEKSQWSTSKSGQQCHLVPLSDTYNTSIFTLVDHTKKASQLLHARVIKKKVALSSTATQVIHRQVTHA